MSENAVLGLVLATAGTSIIERWFVIVNEESKNEWILYELQHEIPVMWYVRPVKGQISLCQVDWSLCYMLNDYMTVKLLTEQNLEFLSFNRGCTNHLSNAALLEITYCVAQNEENVDMYLYDNRTLKRFKTKSHMHMFCLRIK